MRSNDVGALDGDAARGLGGQSGVVLLLSSIEVAIAHVGEDKVFVGVLLPHDPDGLLVGDAVPADRTVMLSLKHS